MSLHKLTAGDGYRYLIRQVAAQDDPDRGFASLGDYYSEKGEAPGIWMGRGVASMPDSPADGAVTEAQMVALFGAGRHPNAERICEAALLAGKSAEEAEAAGRLGAPYRTYKATSAFGRRCAEAYRTYNTTAGLAPGAPVPEGEQARIRTEVAQACFVEAYGRPPADARELSGHLARISRQPTTAVAGYDLTFSPVKSVSTLWAIAPREIATVIEQAHADAVAGTLAWLEDHATYTRTGPHGVAQVEVRGLIAAAFTHRDSRAGDPDLHTHVAVSNKVQTRACRWLALDGRPFHKYAVAASERYNTRLEALLVDRLGIRFADRPSGESGKRPVREIVGVDGELPRFWSSRRTAIDVRRAVLAARFQTEHGRPPTAKEAVALAQQANLETRQAKHSPRSHAQQRATWRTEALRILGGEDGLRDYISRALSPRRAGPSPRRAGLSPQPDRIPSPRLTDAWVARTAVLVLSTVQSSRATWQDSHVRAEAERHVRSAGIRLAEVDRAVDAVVDAALSPPLSTPLTRREEPVGPAVLRRRDGSSVYTPAGSALHTSTQVLAAEQAIVQAAGRRDGRVVPPEAVELALLEAAANGQQLNSGQTGLVRELAGSGARVQLALAPAGTGKTTALRALAAAWRAGGGTVLGLAPSAAAAAVLREQLNPHGLVPGAGPEVPTDTVAKLVHAHSTGLAVPDWLPAVDATTLVLVDEAGMAGTADLAEVIAVVTAAGGTVRLIGDDRQLSAIGAGGVLRDLAATHGAVSLSEVLRFTDPRTGAPNHAEGAASLALRDGDPAALAYYLDHGRVHVGDPATVVEDAYTAWAADRTASRDAILLAPTRELVTELNARARRDRLATHERLPGREVGLADGTRASAGDPVITRRNERTLAVSATDWVKNGDRWTVTAVHGSGALDMTHRRTGRRVTLPADYVRAHVVLGYATTVHGAQGITADITHTVLTGQETRQLLYVALTRGRHANHVFVPTVGDGDKHTLIARDALLPPTATDILTRILARDGSPTSATTQLRALADPTTRLQHDADRYHHALTTAAETQLGPEALTRIDDAAETAAPGLTLHGAYPVLRGHLALLAAAGNSPADVLRHALDSSRGLHDARDVAAVLEWRIDPTGTHSAGAGPLPWLPAIPPALRAAPEWGAYLGATADEVTALAAAVATRARAWTPSEAPPWATPVLDHDRDLVADLAVWRAAHGIQDTDRRPTGPCQVAAADARAQRTLDARVTRLLGDPRTVTAQWAALAESINPRITTDPYWPILADRLTTADRAGIDIATLARTVAKRPLPNEHPAAALWWRLAGHLSPAVLAATNETGPRPLHPDWTPALATALGTAAATRVLADPAWPALVTAVGTARNAGWQPELLLATAHDLLLAGHPDDEPPRPEELTTALVWRIGLLTDPHATTGTPSMRPPADLDQLPAPHGPLDDDWLTSLVEPDEDEHYIPDPSHPDSTTTELADRPRGAAPAGPLAVDRERLLELNRQAADFFTTRYRDSWAAAYLTDRLGTDLADDERFILGYAPADWTALTDHLRRRGATDNEIVAAGLGNYASTGRVIDRFRDRLVFAIRDEAEIHGWIGRRNPTHDHDPAGRQVPKYLNTAATHLFSKGCEMFGLTEGAADLAAGATPVLVEGPLDALAVTVAGDGRYAGIAPLGTAFTDAQAARLTPFLTAEPAGVIVATDADRAGQLAAERIFWRLTARGGDPRHLIVPTGKDPAELLQMAGAAALRQALESSTSLARTLIDSRIATYADQLDTIEGRVHATRRAAQVIAALPGRTWPTHLTHLVAKTGIAPDIALSEVLDAAQAVARDSKDAQTRTTANALGDPRCGHRLEPSSAVSSGTRPAPVLTAHLEAENLADSVRTARNAGAKGRTAPIRGPLRSR